MSAAIAAVSVFGYKFFTLNPELLAQFDWAEKLYPYSYKAFAQAQIAFGWLATAVMLVHSTKSRWLRAFFAVYAVSLFSEFSGTSWGLPFGHYEYTDLLGIKLFNKVPWLIPMSWFFMGLASYRVTVGLFGRSGSDNRVAARVARAALAMCVLVLWDVTLDPAMSQTTPFWIWEQPGSYYGMPALNIFGWAVTGLVIMTIFETALGAVVASRIPLNFAIGIYATNLILPLGLLAAAGAWAPLGITVVLGCLLVVIGRWLGSTLLTGDNLNTARAETTARSVA
jgi:putative membrane protein